jgi:hypothetical protein
MTAAHIGLAAAAAAPNMSAAEAQFRATKPCPATGLARGPCKGYVVDRIVPPICGGAETPANMQWQTLAAAREKNKWERIGCRPGRRLVLPGEPSFIEAYPMDAPAPVIEAEPLTDAR